MAKLIISNSSLITATITEKRHNISELYKNFSIVSDISNRINISVNFSVSEVEWKFVELVSKPKSG